MRVYPYIAFHISNSFYADKLIDNNEIKEIDENELESISNEIVIEHISSNKFTIRIMKDGMILLTINKLERNMEKYTAPFNDSHKNYTVHDHIKVWNDYILYINAFTIILESVLTIFKGKSFLEIREYTKEDVMRAYYLDVTPTNHKFQGCQGAIPFSKGMKRYEDFRTKKEAHYFLSNNSRVIPKNILLEAIENFDSIIDDENLIKILSTLIRSITQYKEGNHETSILFSWFIIESIINDLWEKHLSDINIDFNDGKKRINRNRKKHLSNLNISVIINFLELFEIIPFDLYLKIDNIRDCRNNIVHIEHSYTPSDEESFLSLNCVYDLIKINFNLDIKVKLNLMISPITI